jgi:mannose-6-phosphate isomerase
VDPIVLEPNQLHRFYRGGSRIAELRGTEMDDAYAPEDWVGSTTPVFGSESVGVTVLADGRTLPDAIAAEPEGFLGPEHVERYGPNPCVLVKLLDAGERLPVHLHPDRVFARRHLGSLFGKTEAWFIAAATPGASVHVGFAEDVDERTLKGWVDAQATGSLLGSLNELPVRAGDALFVPAGTPHAIGEGILIVELQEPSDLSVLLEWEGFAIDGPTEGHLGLGFEVALGAVDRSAWDDERLAGLWAARAGDAPRSGVENLFPADADAFFRAERIRPAPTTLPAGFSLLIVADGAGSLAHAAGELQLTRGHTVLVPYAAGECRLEGGMDVLRCMPPSPVAG